MHECIIQLDTTPFDHKDDLMTIDDFISDFDWFVPERADYVDEYDDENEMHEAIKSALDRPGLKYAGGKLTIISKEAYFLDRYNVFLKLVRDACKWSLDDFINGKKWIELRDLNDLYEDELGTCVVDGSGLKTLDDLIRYSKNGDEFYVGSALDYHW